MAQATASFIIFSGDYDRSLAAFTIAAGAAGQGLKVTMFFTFWGLSLLRKTRAPGRSTLQSLFKRLLPVGGDHLRLSRLNFAGIGRRLLQRLIHQERGQDLADLMAMALERGVDLVACEASLKLMGITPGELLASEHVRVGNVHDFLAAARESEICMFI
ncbi:MAG: DsrE/DsrF/DrsH-like family protein [Patescibacteria group bacterium]